VRLYCVDEKVQSPDSTQRSLPRCLGFVEAFTHIRNGTTTAFATLDVATGKVLAPCAKRQPSRQHVTLLFLIDRKVPPDFDVHLIGDNYATPEQAKVRAMAGGPTAM